MMRKRLESHRALKPFGESGHCFCAWTSTSPSSIDAPQDVWWWRVAQKEPLYWGPFLGGKWRWLSHRPSKPNTSRFVLGLLFLGPLAVTSSCSPAWTGRWDYHLFGFFFAHLHGERWTKGKWILFIIEIKVMLWHTVCQQADLPFICSQTLVQRGKVIPGVEAGVLGKRALQASGLKYALLYSVYLLYILIFLTIYIIIPHILL